MDSNTNSATADIDEAKGAFRKLTNDAASRKYRRRSPASRSSSSDESPKRDLSSSPTLLKEDKRRKHDRDDRVSRRSEHGRDNDSYRYSSRSSQGYRRCYGHSREGKYVDEEERNYSRLSSRSGRESKGSAYSDYKERGGDYSRSRDYYHDKDKYNQDRPDAAVRDKRDKYDDRDRCARERNYYRDEKRDYRRSSRDYKSDRITSSEESRRKQDDVISRRESNRQEEANKSDPKGEYKPKHSDEEKKKYEEGDHEEPQERSQDDSLLNRNEEPTVKRSKFSFDSNEPITGSNQGQELLGKGTSGQASINMPESAGNLDAAKVAAMKAAELVNKNLIGTGVMTADQKKKLLWGNKKTTSTEESSHRWDSAIFPDRERQEKFNKLMGVKGDVKVDQNPKSDSLQTEKQREVQLDLEKQYTAGLRRRDGRTVGLGL